MWNRIERDVAYCNFEDYVPSEDQELNKGGSLQIDGSRKDLNPPYIRNILCNAPDCREDENGNEHVSHSGLVRLVAYSEVPIDVESQ